jgi:hypothetical protein
MPLLLLLRLPNATWIHRGDAQLAACTEDSKERSAQWRVDSAHRSGAHEVHKM